jgi:hypothetical protein
MLSSRLIAVVLAVSIVTPAAAEEIPALSEGEAQVWLVASIEFYRDSCSRIIAPANRAMLRAGDEAKRNYVEKNGQPAWDSALAEAHADLVGSELLDATHFICAHRHQRFAQDEQIDTGVKSPSFRCAGETRPALVTICKGGPLVWGYDRALARLDADLAPLLNEKGKALLAEWEAESLEDLAACEERSDCALDILSYRMRRLSELWVKVQERLRTPP